MWHEGDWNPKTGCDLMQSDNIRRLARQGFSSRSSFLSDPSVQAVSARGPLSFPEAWGANSLWAAERVVPEVSRDAEEQPWEVVGPLWVGWVQAAVSLQAAFVAVAVPLSAVAVRPWEGSA